MENPTTIQEQIEALTDAINLINRVRCEFTFYYPKVSNNLTYKSNCTVDRDRLHKAINKLNAISKNLEKDHKTK